MPDAHRRLVYPSTFEALEEIVDVTEVFVRQFESDDAFVYNIVLLTSEAATNAIEHGNDLDPDKSIVVELRCRKAHVEVWVEDEGDGYVRRDIPDPLSTEHLLDSGGRGIFLIEELADEVRYEENGRRIGMLFRRPA